MPSVVILKMGSTFPSLSEKCGDFEDWIQSFLGLDLRNIRVVSAQEVKILPAPRDLLSVILTGSHSMVTDGADWSERVSAWIPAVVESGVPLLGICYGHQLLAHAMGGMVDHNPRGTEFGTVEIHLLEPAIEDPLFQGLPSSIRVHACHNQSVLRLPPGAQLLASNENDPHQAFRIGGSAWGVQFHPEFSADILGSYIRECFDELRREGTDPVELLGHVSETPYGRVLLERFGQISLSRISASPQSCLP